MTKTRKLMLGLLIVILCSALVVTAVMAFGKSDVSNADGFLASASEPTTIAAITSSHKWNHLSDNNLKQTGGQLIGGSKENPLTFFLKEDIKLTTDIQISGYVEICLNGHVLRGAGNNSVITVLANSSFTLHDCNSDNGVHYYTAGVNKDGYLEGKLAESGPYTIYGGVITNSTAAECGGGVHVKEGSTFEMYAGTIFGNTTTNKANQHGGGVYISGIAPNRMSTFIMHNGTIAYNRTQKADSTSQSSNGGGVYVENGTFVMEAGTISNNTAVGNGGGICVTGDQSVLDIKSGTISGNLATRYSTVAVGHGGGVFFRGKTFTMTETEISDNESSLNGGGVYVIKGAYTMNTSSIKRNKTGMDYAGGGVYFGSGGIFVMEKSTIGGNDGEANDGNIGGARGGGIYADGLITITDGTVMYNKLEGSSTELPRTNYGGGIYLYNGTLTVNGTSSFSRNVAKTGGGVYINQGGFSMIGGEIKENQATDANTGGGGVYVKGSFDMDNVIINNNTAISSGGGVYVDGSKARFTMTGGQINSNRTVDKAKAGGGVYVDSGTFTMKGVDTETPGADVKPGEISHNSTQGESGLGGGVYVKYGKFYMSQLALISYNTSTSHGGGVYIDSGTFTMSDSTITQNHIRVDDERSGGGVYVTGSVSTFTMTRGTISENTSPFYGGGVFFNGKEFTMVDGDIVGNEAKVHGGGVYVAEQGTFLMSYNAQIHKNEAKTGSGGGVYFIGSLFQMVDSSIGAEKVIETGAGTDYANKAQDNGGGVYFNGAMFTVNNSSISYNETKSHGGGIFAEGGSIALSVTSVAYNKTGASHNGGGVYFKGIDLTIDSESKIFQNTATVNGGGIYYNCPGKTFTLTNSEINENTATQDGGGVYVVAGSFVMTNSKINGNKVTDKTKSGGGVYFNGTKMTMSGGTISENSANRGAGVYIANEKAELEVISLATISENVATNDGAGVHFNGSKFVLSNSTISDNTADNCGGGVYFVINGDFDMNTNAIISGNTAKVDGGGVYFKGNTFKMNSSFISGNTATRSGGGVYITNSTFTIISSTIGGDNAEDGNTATTGIGGGVYMFTCVFSMSRSTIKYNKTEGDVKDGGGVYFDSTSFHMSYGFIANNSATGSGGGVYVKSGTITVDNGATITGNTAKVHGAGVYFNGTSFTIDNSTVSLNKATQNGGGVYVNSGSLTLTNKAKVLDNEAENGAGIYVLMGEFEMSSTATISRNKASKDGGGVFFEGNGFALSASEISANEAAENGGGVYFKGKTFTMTNSKINSNKATKDGAGVYIYTGTFTMNTGATISGNEATQDGGGVYVISSSSSFTMNNNALVNGNRASRDGAGVYINDSAFTFNNGAISDNIATRDGGGVYVVEGTFDMLNGLICENNAIDGGGVYATNSISTFSNGSITDNRAVKGAGVFVTSGGRYTMNEGKIFTNTATLDGAGIYAIGTTLVFNGGKIYENIATGFGGGIYTESSTFTMTNGEISANQSMSVGKGGGGVYSTLSSVEMSGGSIIDNNAYGNGGGVYIIKEVTFDMSGGIISGNTAISTDGGGVYISTASSFTMSKDAIITKNNATYGAGAYVVKGSVLTMEYNASIVENTARTNGGGVFVTDSSRLVMNNGSISENDALSLGGGVYITDGSSSFTMNGGIISNNTLSAPSSSGGGVYITKATFTMNHGDIFGNRSNTGAGVYINESSGSFTMNYSDAKVYNNVATSNGAGVFVYDGTLSMINGQITGNISSANGGGIYSYHGNCEIDNGVISDNEASQNGGGVYVVYGGTVTMRNGEMSNNRATNGGGVYIVGTGMFEISGGRISGNHITANGGGVYVEGEFKVSGKPVILSNDINNVYLLSGKLIVVTGDLLQGASIGVKLQEGSDIFTTGWTQGDIREMRDPYFTSDDETRYVRWYDQNQLAIVYIHVGDHTGEFIELLKGTANVTFANKGSYFLYEDFYSDLVIENTGWVDLCLNGHTLTGTSNTSVIIVKNEFGLYDCGERGLITGGSKAANGGGVRVEAGADFNMNGGTISGNYASYGGGVYVARGAIFALNGDSVITNNDASSGGGVYVEGRFSIDGTPQVVGNQNSNVYLTSGTVIEIEGELVFGTKTARIGVTLQDSNGTFTSKFNSRPANTEENYTTFFFADNRSDLAWANGDVAITDRHTHKMSAWSMVGEPSATSPRMQTCDCTVVGIDKCPEVQNRTLTLDSIKVLSWDVIFAKDIVLTNVKLIATYKAVGYKTEDGEDEIVIEEITLSSFTMVATGFVNGKYISVNDKSVQVSCTIGKVTKYDTITVEVNPLTDADTAYDGTYSRDNWHENGAPAEEVINITVKSASIRYYKSENGTGEYITVIDTNTPAGTYYAYLVVVGDEDYVDEAKSYLGSFTISAHEWSEWKIDEQHHFRACLFDGCEAQLSADHTPVDADYKASGNHDLSGHWLVCTECNTHYSFVAHEWEGKWQQGAEKHSKQCAVCEQVKAEDHVSDGGVVTKAATCHEVGERTFTCTVCEGVIKTEEIAKLEHVWDEGVVTEKATQFKEGEMTFTCGLCGDTRTESIDKTFPWIAPVAGGVALVGIGVAIWLILKRKKKAPQA